MEHRLITRIVDRAVANARVIQGAPEAVVLVGIIILGVSYFILQHFHRERVAAFNDRIASQEQLLADYRTKLRGATPDDVAVQIEKLTNLLAETQNSLSESKKAVSVNYRSRDPRRLYEDNNPIAVVQEPTVDLDKKRVTFPIVNAAVLLGINKVYEFQNWKLACGGTQLYSSISDGGGHEFSYSPLTCKIVGSR